MIDSESPTVGAVVPKSFDEDTAWTCWFTRHRASVSSARELLRIFLDGSGDGERLLTVGEVVLSELMTNAVLHAVVSPGRMIAVRLELLGGQLRIEVHDASDAWPIVRPLSGWDGDSGRGLWLVDALSVAWGCCSRPGGVGKFVWALVDGKGGGW